LQVSARRSSASPADIGGRAWRGLVLSACLLFTAAVYAADEPLDILIYGASGDVGERLLNEALRRNHHVTAVSRDTRRITAPRPHLEVVEGDLLDPASVRDLAAGRDVILLSVRGAVGGSRDPAQTIHLLGIRALAAALRGQTGDTHLLIVGGAGSLEVRPGVTYAESVPRLFYLFVPRALRQEIAGHRLALDFLANVDDVHWSYVSPPRKLYPGTRTGHYRLGAAAMIYDSDGKSMISMKDFAVAMLDLAEEGGHSGMHLSVVGDDAQ
jgi:putative NADH-flavin reductase